MKCPKCNYENPQTSQFCQNCGYRLLDIEPQISVPAKKPWYKRWWIWLIIGVTVFSCVIGILFGKRSDGSSALTPSNITATTIETTTEKASEKKTIYSPGETFDDDGLKVTFVSFDYYDYPADAAPDNGFKVLQADFELINNDSVSRDYGEKYFKCYADNKPVDIWYSYEDGMHRFGYADELSANREFKGRLYFEVPDDALTIEIEYQPVGGLFDNPKPVIFKVK